MSNNLNFKEAMTKPKFHACDEPGCQTLTSNEFCNVHAEPEPTVEAQTQINADARLAQIKAGEEKSGQWEQRADRMDSLRAELADLRGPGGRSNDHETPVFSNQFEREFS